MGTERFWEDNDLGQKLVEVLTSVTYVKPAHHFGRPFVTAYQLAILLKERFPKVFNRFGHPVEGKGIGVRYSFTSYLARQLSGKLRSGEITNIEGAFLSNRHLVRFQFDDHGETVISSSTDSQYDVSVFSLRDHRE